MASKQKERLILLFKLTLCCAIYLLIVDLLYRVRSFTYYMNGTQILLAVCNMAITLFLISVLVTAVLLFLQSVLSLINRRLFNNRFAGLESFAHYLIAGVFIYLNTFFIYFLLFKEKVEVFGLQAKGLSLLLIFAVLVSGCIFFRRRIRFFLNENINAYFFVSVALCVISLLLTPYLVRKNHSLRVASGIPFNAEEGYAAGSYPNVIIVTFDALNARHMSVYGYPRVTAPNIDEFSRQCYVFDNMYSNSNTSMPSIVSMLTGKYPSTHKTYILRSRISKRDTIENLPRILSGLGFSNYFIHYEPVIKELEMWVTSF